MPAASSAAGRPAGRAAGRGSSSPGGKAPGGRKPAGAKTRAAGGSSKRGAPAGGPRAAGATSPSRGDTRSRRPPGRGGGTARGDTAAGGSSRDRGPRSATAGGTSTAASRSVVKSEKRALAAARTHLVYLVLIPTAALLLLGLVMVFSAGSIIGMGQQMGAYKYFIQQVCWAVLGLGLMVFFWKVDYHVLGRLSWIGVVASVALLGLVLYMGSSAYGAKRWISVGPVNIQPTEIAKFALVVFAAYVLSIKGDKLKRMFHVLVPVVLLALLESGLIMMQPDLGSTIVLCSSVLLLIGVSRAKPGHVLALGVGGASAAMYFALSAPYRRARLFSFIDPWKSARGAGYQVIQSYIALGSGGIKGLGLGMSRQKFLYLPNAHTDFIFAIIGEELGMLGTMTVLALLGVLAYGGLKIASTAPDELGKLLAAGITGLIVVQALVNMGGVTGLLPITGVPLPLVSSGGSSLCVCMGCIGILLNIASRGSASRGSR